MPCLCAFTLTLTLTLTVTLWCALPEGCRSEHSKTQGFSNTTTVAPHARALFGLSEHAKADHEDDDFAAFF